MATKSGCRSNWLVGIFAKHGNPYDGVTLAPALTQVEQLTNVSVQQAVVDKGFRGALHHPSHVNVLVSGKRKLCTTIKKLLKRRSAIEPVIGHCKHDHGMGRNYLQGTTHRRSNQCAASWLWFQSPKALSIFFYVCVFFFCLILNPIFQGRLSS